MLTLWLKELVKRLKNWLTKNKAHLEVVEDVLVKIYVETNESRK